MARRRNQSGGTTAGPLTTGTGGPEDTGQRLAWFALLALVALVPVAATSLTYLGIEARLTFVQYDLIKLIVVRVCALIGLAGWTSSIATRGGKLRFTPVDGLFIGFLVWTALSTALSIHLPTALFGSNRRYEGLFTYLTYAAVYFLTLQLADRSSRIVHLARVFFASATVVALIGVAQHVGIVPAQSEVLSFEANRAYATYGNPDLLAGLMCISLFVGVGLSLLETRPRWKMAYWAAVGVNGFALIATFTRGSWIGAAVGAAFFGWFVFGTKMRIGRLDWMGSAASVALASAAALGSLSSRNDVTNVANRISSIGAVGEGSALTRLQIWRAALRAIVERPLLGSGPDTFRMVFARFKTADYVRTTGALSVADNAHNHILNLAVGVGIPGAILFYAFLGWAAIRSARGIVSGRQAGLTPLMIGLWAGCVSYVVHLFFGISVVGSTVFLFMCTALLLAPGARTVSLHPFTAGRVLAWAVVVGAILGVLAQVPLLAADRYFLLSTRTSGTESIVFAEKASHLAPWNDVYVNQVGWSRALSFIGQAEMLGRAPATSQPALRVQAQQTLTAAESGLMKAAAFTPVAEENNYSRLANLYVVAAAALDPRYGDLAVQAAKTAVAKEPNGPQTHYMLGYAFLQQGKRGDAIRELRKARRLDPQFVDVVLLLASALDQDGRRADALDVLGETSKLVPGDSRIEQAQDSIESERDTSTLSPDGK